MAPNNMANRNNDDDEHDRKNMNFCIDRNAFESDDDDYAIVDFLSDDGAFVRHTFKLHSNIHNRCLHLKDTVMS